MNAFSLTITNGIARLVFDLPGEKVNKFSFAAMEDLDRHLAELEGHREVRLLVLTSAKPGVFIAGADITMLARISEQAEAEAKAREGQRVFNRLADLPFPTMAVIDGACLGGGLECALACTWRVVTDGDKVKLGLPEVSLGIIPGWGGTHRLPRLIGLRGALDLIASGRPVNGKKALQMGLADVYVAQAFLEDELPRVINQVLDPAQAAALVAKRVRPFSERLMGQAPFRSLVLGAARKEILRKTKGQFPAPLAALDVLARTAGAARERGLSLEARTFARLAPTPTCKALIDAFFASEEVKKVAAKPEHEAQSVGVLGAGVMGGGIAWAVSAAGLPVRVKDLTWDAVAKGLATANGYNQALVKMKKCQPGEANLRMHRIAGTLDWSGFERTDVVIEAVVEDLHVKRKVLAEAERHVRGDTILASNTSSLSITAMAEGLQDPTRLVGMHFFNPVNRMPLVEVIAGTESSPEAIGRVAALAQRLGKTVVVVRDCPGFLVNRILLPYMNEAARCLEDGGDVAGIDAVITRFGMPMGPFTLTDEVGIDVGFKVARILEAGYGPRHAVADLLRIVYEELHLLGTKAGAGFFLHNGKRLDPNPAIAQALAKFRASRPVHDLTPQEVEDRCLLTMVNEAARCIEEQVIEKPQLLDLAMLMGTGFPPAKGGPLHYADARGIPAVVDALKRLRDTHGARFEPSPLLVEMAKTNRRFITRP